MPICREILIIEFGDRESDWIKLLSNPDLAEGVQVEAAEGAETAKEAARRFDAIFLALGGSGHHEEALGLVTELSANLPVLLILHDPDPAFEESVMRVGAQDCLVSTELDDQTLSRSLRLAIERNKSRLSTKLAESEQRLHAFQESQAFYHSLVENLNHSIFRKDRQGRFTFGNRVFCEYMDVAPSEILGKTDFDFFPEEFARKYHEDDLAVLKTGQGTDEEENYETAEGEILIVRTVKSPVYNDNGEIIGLQGFFWDITAQKRAEEELAASRERFELAVRGSSDGIWDWNVLTGEVYYADRFKELLGYPPDGFEDTFDSFRKLLHPDDREATLAAIDAHLKERVAYDVEYRLRRKTGDYRWFRARGLALWDPEGKATRMAGSISNIHARKQAEKALLERSAELERSNQDLEQFAWVASHDLKEPLRAVSNYVQLIERRYNDKLDDEGRRFIGFATEGAARMRVLINDLLAFSRIGTRGKALVPTELDDALSSALKNLELVVAEREARIAAEPLPRVLGDSSQLIQVFQNLVGNAIKFCDQRPEIHIWSEQAGTLWRIHIKDNGIGMDPAHVVKVFEIFQRLHTRDKYDGTGIGLAVVRKIVERHGGSIDVASRPGEGCTFSFTLRDATGQ